jgi:hypothetical protein
MKSILNAIFTGVLLLSFLLNTQSTNLKSKLSDFSGISDIAIPFKTHNKQEIPLPDNTFANNIVSIPSPSSCNYLNCKSPYGKCSDTHTCICNNGYVHAPYTMHNKLDYCQYKQKSQLIALVLEFVFFFGAGHFYSSRTMIAFIKFFFTCVGYYLHVYFNEKDAIPELSIKKGGLKYAAYFLIWSIFVFHLYDIFMISKNKYFDGNGIPIIPFI